MKKNKILIKKYDWTVFVYENNAPSDYIEICNNLINIECTDDALLEAEKHLSYNTIDKGLTYSNIKNRKSVVVICKASTEKELINTICHECMHVVAHVCEANGIDMHSEEACYLLGWLCGKCYIG